VTKNGDVEGIGGWRDRKRKMWECRKWKREYNRVLWGKMEGWHWRLALISQKEKKMIDLLAWEMTSPSRRTELLTRYAQTTQTCCDFEKTPSLAACTDWQW